MAYWPRLTERARFFPTSDAIDVILNVNRAEEECHHAAQLQTNVFGRIVVFLHSRLDAEHTEQVNDGAAYDEQTRNPW
jgi:hypothetical protein